jgi:ParB-like chromosome segregation protein Spo0J
MSKLALKLKINPEYEALVYRPTNEEYIQLRDDINQNGQYYPIIVNKSGTILDGNTRYKILNELKAEPIVSVKTFDSKLQEQLFVINANLQRWHLNSFQRITLALKTKPILEEIARRNQKTGIHLTHVGERSRLLKLDMKQSGKSN